MRHTIPRIILDHIADSMRRDFRAGRFPTWDAAIPISSWPEVCDQVWKQVQAEALADEAQLGPLLPMGPLPVVLAKKAGP